ncbi:MAG: metal ABC transporter ATP-binding protein [Planctomycetota bacterium]
MSEPSHEARVSHEHVEHGVVCIHHVSYTYPDGTLALEDINLHVARGETLAVVGPNGAGKTTLLKILLGLIDGYRGQVLIADRPPERAQQDCAVAWVPQRSQLNTTFPVTVGRLVRLGLAGKAGLLRRPTSDQLDSARRALHMLELERIADRPIGSVSGGQLQRALIARALAPKPELLLLDEPMVGIDPAGQEQFHELLDTVKAEFGVTLIMVSHDIRAMLTGSQRVACLDRTLHFHDVPEKLTPDVLSSVFHYNVQGLRDEREHADIAGGHE